MVACMNMHDKKILVVAGAGLAVLVMGVAGFMLLNRGPVAPEENLSGIENPEGVATGTPSDPAPSGTQSPGVLPGITAVLPPGATAIDKHAFTDENGVQFLSITSSSMLVIPDAEPDTFKRITDFMTSPDPAVKNTCGVSGSYAFYADSKRVYFYQFWLAPKFRTSRVEVIAGAKPATFSVVDGSNFKNGDRALYLDYDVSVATTTTCTYAIRAR